MILLPGTLYDMADTWQALGPILADDGWCVYGLNYGATASTTLSGGRIWSVGDIPTSAGQLATFVGQVLAATGASKVDLVGWSQGGMMPRWYLRFDGGAAYVHDLVGLAPSNHGTTVDGMSALFDAVTALGLPAPLTLAQCPACTQQLAGSAFLQQLNAGEDTVPGVALHRDRDRGRRGGDALHVGLPERAGGDERDAAGPVPRRSRRPPGHALRQRRPAGRGAGTRRRPIVLGRLRPRPPRARWVASPRR